MPINTQSLGFEKIFGVQQITRGDVDVSEYKHIVLGFIFYVLEKAR